MRFDSSQVVKNLRQEKGEFGVYPVSLMFDTGFHIKEQIIHSKPIIYSGWACPKRYPSILTENSLTTYLIEHAEQVESPLAKNPNFQVNNPTLEKKARLLYDCIISHQQCDQSLMTELKEDLTWLSKLQVNHFLLYKFSLELNFPLFTIFEKLFGAPVD